LPEKQTDERQVTTEASRTSKRPAILPFPRHVAAVFLLIVIAGLIIQLSEGRPARTGFGPVRSLAVLPLANLSGDPEEGYLVEGMADSLRQHLEAISAVRVVSRTSSMSYRAGSKPLPEIARQLNADAVVEGSVLRSGNRVRMNVELIQTTTDTHVSSGSYDRDLKDIFVLQAEVAQKIA
jgi:TolB-like protein